MEPAPAEAPAPAAPSGRATRELILIIGALALVTVLEKARGGIERLLFAQAAVLLGPLFLRVLARRARLAAPDAKSTVLVLLSFGGFVTHPPDGTGFWLSGLAALALALPPLLRPPAESPRASLKEEALVLVFFLAALAGAAFQLRAFEATSLPLALLALALVEAYAPGAPRTTGAATRRVASVGLLLGLEVLHGYYEHARLLAAHTALLLAPSLVGLATALVLVFRAARSRLPERVALALAWGVLLFLLLNGVVHLGSLALGDRLRFRTETPIETLKARSLEDCYPGWQRPEIEALLRETWTRPYVFEAYTHFRERPFAGKFVNVHEGGFRLGKTKLPWPPEPGALNVFCFGGSTTFGYGLADAETVPAFLEEELAKLRPKKTPRVYNFGRGCYFSSQESILFLRLLAEGRKPDVAIFMDGLNDFSYPAGEPDQSFVLARFVDERALGTEDTSALSRLAGRLPVVALARALARREPPPVAQASLETWNRPELHDVVLDRYERVQRELRAVARAEGVAPLFVWQPAPFYRYQAEGHRRLQDGTFGAHTLGAFGYPALAKRLEKRPADPDFFWAADLQEGLEGSLYVDMLHYSAKLSRVLAERIARELRERKLLEREGG